MSFVKVIGSVLSESKKLQNTEVFLGNTNIVYPRSTEDVKELDAANVFFKNTVCLFKEEINGYYNLSFHCSTPSEENISSFKEAGLLLGINQDLYKTGFLCISCLIERMVNIPNFYIETFDEMRRSDFNAKMKISITKNAKGFFVRIEFWDI